LGRPSRLAAALLLAAVASLASSLASARSQSDTLAEAVTTYTEALHSESRDVRLARFRRAQALFASLTEQGVRSADLYVNLGNAALQAEDLGAAVLAYRRALTQDADHPRALQNLEHARTGLPAWVPRPEAAGVFDSLFFWHRTVAEPVREQLAAVCFAAAALLVAASLRFRQTVLRNAAILPLLAWLALVASLLLDPVGDAGDAAVVVVPDSVARAADSSLAPSALPQPLPAGVEVRILEERSPWLRVRLASGRDAWLHGSSVERVLRVAQEPRSASGVEGRDERP
jgi:tetratricopeptide (TPR) repeat protein